MKYDFDTIINRRNTNSHKWDYQDTQLPMWLGDMDFKTAPEIIQELDKRVQHGIFGYALIPDDFFQAYINWWERRHDFKMEKEELLFSIGVMPSIATIIRELTKENESILLQTPVYNYFFKVIQNNNRKVIENELIYDGIHYSIDFKDLEEKLSDENTTMMILCNPHNPIGKIWNKEELERIAHLCKKHGVFLISDEIHCDLVNPGNNYTPVENTVNEKDHIITCLAPTKTFNIAGIQSSLVHINDKNLYERIQSRLDFEYSSQVNVFTIVATITAFNECKERANQLNEYIYQNKLIVDEFLKKELPIVKLVPSEATYFLWLDCNEIKIPSKQLNEYINETAGLFMVPGVYFGENGDNFLRLNIACPKDTLLDGLNRLKKAINSLNK
jgi:cystathionine beta-lyase